MIEDGKKLWLVKKLLPRGEFGDWRRAEFRSRERTPFNCMAVAKWLGSKTAIIAHWAIAPTACYRLVGRSVPEEARQEVIALAAVAIAIEIIAKVRNKPGEDVKRPAEKRQLRLVGLLDRHQARWYPTEHPLLAKQLRHYADSLATGKANKAATKAM